MVVIKKSKKSMKLKERVRKLRINNRYTQAELAEKLNDYFKKEKDNVYTTLLDFSDENSAIRIAKLESDKTDVTLTIDLAMAYSKIFDVSLDYLYGNNNHSTSGYEEMLNKTGLTNESINTLHGLTKKGFGYKSIDILNMLLSYDCFTKEYLQKTANLCDYLKSYNKDKSKKKYISAIKATKYDITTINNKLLEQIDGLYNSGGSND